MMTSVSKCSQPLRRSQRLSRRQQQSSSIIWNSVYITPRGKIVRQKGGNQLKSKTAPYLDCASTQSIFSPSEVREDEELRGAFTFQQTMKTRRGNFNVKMEEETEQKEGVKLTLTDTKSKVSFDESPMTWSTIQLNSICEEPNLERDLKGPNVSTPKQEGVLRSPPFPCYEGSESESLNPDGPQSKNYNKSECKLPKCIPEINKTATKRGRPRNSATVSKRCINKTRRNSTRPFSPKLNLFKYCEVSNTILRPLMNRSHIAHNVSHSKDSILPDVYPLHFRYQLPPDAVLNDLMIQPNLMTPDETQFSERNPSVTSSPSLPDSLRGIFETDDLKQLLNIENVTSYHLQDYHIRALAAILGLRFEYLCTLLDRILQVTPNVLNTVTHALKTPFVQDRDLFGRESSIDSGSSNDIILDSQSCKSYRFLKTQAKQRVIKRK